MAALTVVASLSELLNVAKAVTANTSSSLRYADR